MFLKPIFTSLSPNTQKDDVARALRLIFQPWLWKKGEAVNNLEEKFKQYLGVNYAVSFNSGRSGLTAILRAMNIKNGDEVLLQAFTCNAAVNPILSFGAKPVFVDIDERLNIDPEDLRRKITPRSKVLMIQHTFGWPAQVDEVFKIARENRLLIIEDCAHALGARYKGRFCGTLGDAAFFSFGRDKVISSVFGGMVVTNNSQIGERINNFQKKLNCPSRLWIFQQLLHPVLTLYLILPLYRLNFFLGRVFLGIFHRLRFLSKAVYKKEKQGQMPKCFPKKLPNCLALLALGQFGKLEKFNKHRRDVARFYEENIKSKKITFPLRLKPQDQDVIPVFMRYPLLVNFGDTDQILKEAQKEKIYLNDGWRKSPIVPPDTDISKMQYHWGDCPSAERVANSIINLPTHIGVSLKDAERIVNFFNQYGN